MRLPLKRLYTEFCYISKQSQISNFPIGLALAEMMKAMLIHPPRQIACSDRLFPPGSPCWCPGRKGGSGSQKTRPGSTRSDNHDNGDEHVMVMELVMIMQKRLINLVPILMQIKATWTTLGLRRSLRINWRARSPEFGFDNCQHPLRWLYVAHR